jgi:hypothetical protein
LAFFARSCRPIHVPIADIRIIAIPSPFYALISELKGEIGNVQKQRDRYLILPAVLNGLNWVVEPMI